MNDWIDAEARVERARELYEKGRWVEAAAELRAAIDVNPENADWYFNLALTLDAMEDYQRACEAYRTALKLEPGDVETLNCLGVDMTRLGHYREALRCFEQVEKIDPRHEGCYCNRIVTYTEMEDHENAELMFYLARQVKTVCPLCYYNIGGSLYARGLYDRAIACWQQTLKLDEQHPDANARIAEAHWAKGDLAAARHYYELELHLDPNHIDTLLDYGELLMDLGQDELSAAQFRNVLEQSPDNAGAHFGLGELAIKQGQLVQAEEQLRLVLRIERDFPGAHAKLADVLLQSGRTKHALKHLIAELRHCGDDLQMLQELGQLLIRAKHIQRANTVFQRLVRLAPLDAHAHHNLAVSYFMLGKLDEGICHCRKALKLKSDYALALYNLALAHMQQGQLSRARRYVGRAKVLAPTDEQIRRLSRKLGPGGFWISFRDKMPWTYRE